MGGNAFRLFVEQNGSLIYTNLHTVWDSLALQYDTQFKRPFDAAASAFITNKARSLMQNHTYQLMQQKYDLLTIDPIKWAQAGHDLAVNYAYLNGSLVVKN